MTELPLRPPRENFARDCTIVEDGDVDLPDHIHPCTCPSHDGVCDDCGCKITVGPSGIEYGHARAKNRDHETRSERGDCGYRPASVDPGKPGPPSRGEADG